MISHDSMEIFLLAWIAVQVSFAAWHLLRIASFVRAVELTLKAWGVNHWPPSGIPKDFDR